MADALEESDQRAGDASSSEGRDQAAADALEEAGEGFETTGAFDRGEVDLDAQTDLDAETEPPPDGGPDAYNEPGPDGEVPQAPEVETTLGELPFSTVEASENSKPELQRLSEDWDGMSSDERLGALEGFANRALGDLGPVEFKSFDPDRYTEERGRTAPFAQWVHKDHRWGGMEKTVLVAQDILERNDPTERPPAESPDAFSPSTFDIIVHELMHAVNDLASPDNPPVDEEAPLFPASAEWVDSAMAGAMCEPGREAEFEGP